MPAFASVTVATPDVLDKARLKASPRTILRAKGIVRVADAHGTVATRVCQVAARGASGSRRWKTKGGPRTKETAGWGSSGSSVPPWKPHCVTASCDAAWQPRRLRLHRTSIDRRRAFRLGFGEQRHAPRAGPGVFTSNAACR
ncbi:GTP-binding protein [Burkholderia metallica]|uniref:GTP-binding protein n=1 Tax=Burkholderia metallica TaxID=488729 RepID=UPI001CF5B062|nr:GTP-binding protein [Burkholderia metallica]MCA8000361.1 GTP-binding protein [Burkholderia metallica]